MTWVTRIAAVGICLLLACGEVVPATDAGGGNCTTCDAGSMDGGVLPPDANTACIGCTAVWTLVTPMTTSPPGRTQHALAYDTQRDRVVLFGGETGNTFLGDTWEWDGAAWTQRTPASAPAARWRPAMVYDSGRGRAVLFGGYVANAYVRDTWEWDGTNWTDVSPPLAGSPPIRYGAAMAYDVDRQRVVMFGGFGNAYRNDTWEWDGTSWTDVTPAGASPSVRYASSMAYDTVRRRLVLFGGGEGGNLTGDTWQWDGASWTDVSPVGSPPARGHHAVTFDTRRGRAVAFGGLLGGGGGAALNDTWQWDGLSWTDETTTETAPSTRYSTVMTYDAQRERIILFGGDPAGGSDLGDTWELRFVP